MDPTDQLFILAERLLDNGDYSEARLAYREAAMKSLPTPNDLFCLGVAERNEFLMFRLSLIEKYPESLDVHLNYAHLILEGTNAYNSIRYCDKLLQKPGLTKDEVSRIRRTRFLAATAEPSPDNTNTSNFTEDCVSILRSIADLQSENPEQFKIELMQVTRNLMRIRNPLLSVSLNHIMEQLPANYNNYVEIKNILRSKVEELDSLFRLMSR